MRALAATMLVATSVAMGAPSWAEPSRAWPVVVAVDECVVADAALVHDVVAAELGAPPVTERGVGGVIQVALTCDARLVRIAVVDPVTGKQLQRRIDLGVRSPREAGRVLGLAVSELVAASWAELELAAKPVVDSPDATATDDDRVAARAAIARRRAPPWSATWSLALAGGQRRFAKGPAHTSLGVSGGWVWSERFAAALELDVASGTTPVDLGRVRARSASLAARIDVDYTIDRLELRAGVGAVMGAAWVKDIPDAPSPDGSVSLVRMWAGPIGVLGARVRATRHWDIRVALEIGTTLVGVSADSMGQQVPLLQGTWAGARVGVGCNF